MHHWQSSKHQWTSGHWLHQTDPHTTIRPEGPILQSRPRRGLLEGMFQQEVLLCLCAFGSQLGDNLLFSLAATKSFHPPCCLRVTTAGLCNRIKRCRHVDAIRMQHSRCKIILSRCPRSLRFKKTVTKTHLWNSRFPLCPFMSCSTSSSTHGLWGSRRFLEHDVLCPVRGRSHRCHGLCEFPFSSSLLHVMWVLYKDGNVLNTLSVCTQNEYINVVTKRFVWPTKLQFWIDCMQLCMFRIQTHYTLT